MKELRDAERDAAWAAKIEALADEARARRGAYPKHPHWEAWNAHEADLRALLSADDDEKEA